MHGATIAEGITVDHVMTKPTEIGNDTKVVGVALSDGRIIRFELATLFILFTGASCCQL
jgi:hypothetical protein